MLSLAKVLTPTGVSARCPCCRTLRGVTKQVHARLPMICETCYAFCIEAYLVGCDERLAQQIRDGERTLERSDLRLIPGGKADCQHEGGVK